MIDLDEVAVGDELTISDRAGNRCRGVVSVHAGGLYVAAFETIVKVGQVSRTSGKRILVPGLRVLDHQPQLFEAR